METFVYLFKYLHPDRIDVLKNKAIRFSQPDAFNDPFEFKPVINSVCSNDYFQNYVDENLDCITKEELSNMLPPHIRNLVSPELVKAFVKRYLQDNHESLGNVLKALGTHASQIIPKKSNELIGVLSLTEKKDNLLMWSHYADSHRGYCIGFDSTHSFFNRKRSEKDEFYHLRKVKYLQDRPSKTMDEMDGIDMFLLKSDVWEYEQEWRICSVLSDANTILESSHVPPVCLFNFPSEVVKEVIIGANASNEFIENIANLINQDPEFKHVKLKLSDVSSTQYGLEFNDL